MPAFSVISIERDMRKEITSTQNRIYKLCTQLSAKKYRDRENRYVIEGENLINEAIKCGAKIDCIIFREGTTFNINGVSKIDEYTMPEKLFNTLAQTETSQGILAIVEKPTVDIESVKTKNKLEDNIVILDRLQDPGNIGTIIRTADAVGYLAVIAIKGTGDVFSPKVVRAATGSVFRIPIILVEDNRELLQLVTDLNKRLVATAFDTDNFYYDQDLSKGIALVIGNEGNGISEELIQDADIKVKIPMEGNIESLNASVAAGILMYEAMRCK